MVFVFILTVIVIQVVVIGIIVAILWTVLNRRLTELTIRKFETLNSELLEKETSDLTVVTCGKLSEDSQRRISDAFYKKTRRAVHLIIAQDKTIKGGIIIKQKSVIEDGSLKGRLKESGLMRS